MSSQLNQKTTKFENLSFSFLVAGQSKIIGQKEPQKTKQHGHERHTYFAKETNQFICLTQRQHQCLWLYHQYKNVKSVAAHIGISYRTTEEYLRLAREKLQFQRIKGLMNAIDNQLIECVDKKVLNL